MRGSTGMTMAGTVLGHPSFMPPAERAGSAPRSAPDRFLWALGATMFYLLRASSSSASTQSMELIAAMTEPAPPIRWVAPELPEAFAYVVDSSARLRDGGSLARGPQHASGLRAAAEAPWTSAAPSPQVAPRVAVSPTSRPPSPAPPRRPSALGSAPAPQPPPALPARRSEPRMLAAAIRGWPRASHAIWAGEPLAQGWAGIGRASDRAVLSPALRGSDGRPATPARGNALFRSRVPHPLPRRRRPPPAACPVAASFATPAPFAASNATLSPALGPRWATGERMAPRSSSVRGALVVTSAAVVLLTAIGIALVVSSADDGAARPAGAAGGSTDWSTASDDPDRVQTDSTSSAVDSASPPPESADAGAARPPPRRDLERAGLPDAREAMGAADREQKGGHHHQVLS